MTLSQECDDNSFECGTGIALIIIFFLVCLTNLIFFIKTFMIHRIATYELIAVFVACVDGLCLVLYELFLKNIITVLISNFLELLIFSLINYCFVTGYFILVMGETFQSKILRGFFGLFWLMISIILITGLVGTPPYNCDNRFSFHWVFFSACSLGLALNSFIFGVLLLRVSISKEREIERESKNTEGQRYFIQQRKILITLSISFIIAIILSFGFDLELKNLLENTDEIYCEDSSTLIMDSSKAQIVSFLRSISWLIPLLMLPVCIYIIPYIDERKWRTESTAVVFDNNMAETSFLGGGNKFIGLNRDTVLFNKSHLFKSSLSPSFLIDNKYKKGTNL